MTIILKFYCRSIFIANCPVYNKSSQFVVFQHDHLRQESRRNVQKKSAATTLNSKRRITIFVLNSIMFFFTE